MEQADGDRLDAEFAESARGLPDLVVAQRPQNLSARAHPLVHFEA